MENPFSPPEAICETADERSHCPVCDAKVSKWRLTLPFATKRCRVCGVTLYVNLDKDKRNLLGLFTLVLLLPGTYNFFTPQFRIPDWLLVLLVVCYPQILNLWFAQRYGVVKLRNAIVGDHNQVDDKSNVRDP